MNVDSRLLASICDILFVTLSWRLVSLFFGLFFGCETPCCQSYWPLDGQQHKVPYLLSMYSWVKTGTLPAFGCIISLTSR